MLQDLDALSERLGQVASLVSRLRSERSALQARVRQLEQECQAVKAQQAREHAEFVRMSERVARHDHELAASRDEAERAREALEGELRDHRAQGVSLRQQLDRVETDRDRLRAVATGAQQQIELILERLPGAGG